MKRFFTVLLALVIVLLLVAAVGKNYIAKTAISAGVRAMTGLKLSIDKMDVGVLKSALGINELKIYNPEGYADTLMLDMPEIYVDYDLPAFFRKKIHLEEVRIDMNRFVVVKNTDGTLNLDALKTVQKAKEKPAVEETPKEKAAAPQFQIDLLKLKVGTVVYKDYSKGAEPAVREFNLNIDRQYENIDNPQALAASIMFTALANTTIGSLTGFDVNGLTEGLSDTLKGAVGIAGETAGKAVEAGKEAGQAAQELLKDTTGAVEDTLKKLLPFGK